MTRPPLTLALSSVLAAAVECGGRPALLATMHPEFGRALAERAGAESASLAQVIPLPRVIAMHRPMPRQRRGAADPQPLRTVPGRIQRIGQNQQISQTQQIGRDQHEPDPAA